jgi:hypothetical protein
MKYLSALGPEQRFRQLCRIYSPMTKLPDLTVPLWGIRIRNRIRIRMFLGLPDSEHQLEVRIRIRLRLLPFSNKFVEQTEIMLSK